MKKIYIILMIAAVLMILSSCEENESPVVYDHNANLEGDVVFADGTPDTLSAEVSASRDNLVLATVYTDETGHYMMNGLSAGLYYISINLTGYSSQSFSVYLTSNETVTAAAVLMEPMESMQMDSKVIDGEIDGGWMPVYTQDHVSGWGPNDFDELYLAYDEDYLYVAVTGEFSTSDNTVCICIDTDGSGDTGINDFSVVDGGDIGGYIRKNITAPDSYGANIVINSGWGLSAGEGIVSLDDPASVDTAMFEDVIISMNSSTLEFAISLEEIYGELNLPSSISIVTYIGGGGDQYFANDVIPQGADDFTGTFQEVFTIGY